MMMQSISEMNNKAALLMESGSYRDALDILDVGLDKMQHALGSEDKESTSMDNLTSNNDSLDKASRKPIFHSDEFTVSNEDYDFIYQSPIRSEDLPVEDLDKYSISVILIFNMALCHHWQALNEECDKRKQTRLRKALKLYELSFCMQIQGGTQLTMTQVLALVNNCGQIYKQLDRQRKAKKFFQHMLTTLMAMIEIGDAQDVEQLDGFMWNASRLILNDPAFAPAA